MNADEIAEVLERDNAGIDELEVALAAHEAERRRLVEQHNRIARKPWGMTEDRPVEREAALGRGDAAAVVEMDRQAREISTSLDVLKHRESCLREKLAAAKGRAAVENAPTEHRRLVELLDAEAEARRRLNAARQAVEHQFTSLREQRRAARIAGVGTVPAADPVLLRKYVENRGFQYESGNGWGRAARPLEIAADALGLPMPGRREVA